MFSQAGPAMPFTFEQFGPIWTATAFYPMARGVFGADVLAGQTARLDAVLANNGYSPAHVSVKQRHQAIAFVLLLNHSPWLDDLSWAALERAASTASAHAASIWGDIQKVWRIGQIKKVPRMSRLGRMKM
jgi:hypothetical protein